MLTLYQFPGPWDVVSASPFCAKLEAFLRWQKIPYRTVEAIKLKDAPKGKIPYIEYDDAAGKRVKLGDSQFIIEHLTKMHHLDPDQGLTPEQKAQSRAIRYLCEESLYRAMGYFNWIDDQGFAAISRAFFKGIPAPIRPLVTSLVRRYVRKQLIMQGIARHSRDEVIHIAGGDLQALSDWLGDKPFFFGDSITTADLVVFSLLVNFLSSPFPNPIADIAKALPNLINHTERVKSRYFS